MKKLVENAHIWMDEYMKSFYEEDEEVMLGIKTKEETMLPFCRNSA